MKVKPLIVTSLALVSLASSPNSRADVVTDWNQIMLTALVTANLSPIVAIRAAAIVQAVARDFQRVRLRRTEYSRAFRAGQRDEH